MIVFWDTQLTVRQNPTLNPTFPGKKLGQNVGIRRIQLHVQHFRGKKLNIEKTLLMLDFSTDFSRQKTRALSRALAENRLRDRLFEAENSSIESSIRKRLRKTAVFNHFKASACTPSQHRSIMLLRDLSLLRKLVLIEELHVHERDRAHDCRTGLDAVGDH